MVKKIPQRMCLGCQERKNKKELIRIVRSPEGEIDIDMTGKKNGRGAYICPDIKCLEAVIKTKRLEKSLEVEIDEQVYEKLREQLK